MPAVLQQITAGCVTVEPWAALVTDMIAGVLYWWGSDFLVKCKLDDAVDAIPVHMLSGFWGLIVVALFSNPELMLHAYGDDSHPCLFYVSGRSNADCNLIVCQLLGALFIVAWNTVTMFPFFMWLNFMGWFRCESAQKLVGLNITYDGERAAAMKNAEGSEKDLKEKHLNAYARHGQSMQAPRTSHSHQKRKPHETETLVTATDPPSNPSRSNFYILYVTDAQCRDRYLIPRLS